MLMGPTQSWPLSIVVVDVIVAVRQAPFGGGVAFCGVGTASGGEEEGGATPGRQMGGKDDRVCTRTYTRAGAHTDRHTFIDAPR